MEKGKVSKPRKRKLRMMALSLVMAVIVWFMVMSLTNPTISVTVYNLHVKLIGEMELGDKNLAVTGRENFPSPSVVVKGSRSDLINYMDDIYVKVDVSNIDSEGEYKLSGTISIPTTRISVERENYGEITVNVEDVISKELEVTVSQTGSAEGRVVKSEAVNPKVVISGAKSEIESVASAEASVDITGMTSDNSRMIKYLLKNSDGEPITDNETIESPRSEIEVRNTVYQAKTLPVIPVLSDALQADYTLNAEETVVSPSSITVGITGEIKDESLPVIITEPEGEQKYELNGADGIYIPEGKRIVTVNVKTEAGTSAAVTD